MTQEELGERPPVADTTLEPAPEHARSGLRRRIGLVRTPDRWSVFG